MKFSFKKIKFIFSLFIVAFFFYLTVQYFDGESIMDGITAMIQSPFTLSVIVIVYFLSFCLKALAWKVYLNGRPRLSTCLLGVLYSLVVNHLLPIKAGDLVRMKILSTRDEISGEESFNSVIILRLLDMVCLIGITLVGLLVLEVDFNIPTFLIMIGSILLLIILICIMKFFPVFLKRQMALLKQGISGRNGLVVFSATFVSWILEAAVLLGAVIVFNQNLSIFEAVFANSVTISGQIFQITPGGIANYESFLVFALRSFGITIQEGYTIAIVTHTVKFFFSYAAGIMAIIIYPIPFNTMLSWIRVKGVRGS